MTGIIFFRDLHKKKNIPIHKVGPYVVNILFSDVLTFIAHDLLIHFEFCLTAATNIKEGYSPCPGPVGIPFLSMRI